MRTILGVYGAGGGPSWGRLTRGVSTTILELMENVDFFVVMEL